MKQAHVQFLDQEELLEEGMAPTPVFLPGESHGQRSLAGYTILGELGTQNQVPVCPRIDILVAKERSVMSAV